MPDSQDSPPPQPPFDAEELVDVLDIGQMVTPHLEVAALLAERPCLESRVAGYDPIASAEIISGMIATPGLQANQVRLEMLVHLLLVCGKGSAIPTRHRIGVWINTELGSSFVARMEDPPEDIFTSNVITREGNSRIFDGTWESSAFYLQNVLDVVDTLPDNSDSSLLNRQIMALLRLSDEIAERRGLARYATGGGEPNGDVAIPSLRELEVHKASVIFTEEDLIGLGVTPDDLAPFLFPMADRERLKDQTRSETDLERRPVVHAEGRWSVLLPAAISPAIRAHVFEWMATQGLQDSFDKNYASTCLHSLDGMRGMGFHLPPNAPLAWAPVGHYQTTHVMRKIDAGRWLQVVLVVEGVTSFLKHGFSRVPCDPSVLSKHIREQIDNARSKLAEESDFRQGLTLVVHHGYGGMRAISRPEAPTDWWAESVSAADLETMFCDSDFSPLLVWRLVSHQRDLESQGISIENMNGLLNLYSWWKKTDYALVPTDLDIRNTPSTLMIPLDCLAETRAQVKQDWDQHALPLPDGQFTPVKRVSLGSYFPGEDRIPMYAAYEAVGKGTLLAAYSGQRSVWWLTALTEGTGLSRDELFQVFDAVQNWLQRAVPVLEQHVDGVPTPALIVLLDFGQVQRCDIDPVDEDTLRSCLAVSVDSPRRRIHIRLQDPFMGGFRKPENVAERTLVRGVVKGALLLCGQDTDEVTLDAILGKIIPNDDARYFHIFQANDTRSHVTHADAPEKLLVPESDFGRAKIGLGWLAQGDKIISEFNNAEESADLLNSVVGKISERMRSSLHCFDRAGVVEQCLRRIEGNELEKRRWESTLRANLALRGNRPAALQTGICQ
jgi:hypothetical protein